MSVKEGKLPKAVNVIRPSSPLLQRRDYSTSTSSSAYTSTTISTLSSFNSNNSFYNNTRSQPMIISPSNQSYIQSAVKNTNPVASPIGVNPYRFLQKPRSNSNLSRSTYFSNLSTTSSQSMSDDEQEEDEEDVQSDLDSIDGLSDSEEGNIDDDQEDDAEDEEEEEVVTKVVAKVKHGTILNGKGEFVNKGSITEEQHSTWLDEARANRKIADLEIEKASLLVLNGTLEAKLRQQTLQIAELQKRLQMNEGPITPTSDKHVEELLLFDDENTVVSNESVGNEELEHDQVFHRLNCMIESLILQAEAALIQKSKQSGKVLQNYNLPLKDQETQQIHIEDTNMPKRRISLKTRRTSDNTTPTTPSVKMARNLSRQSSPPILVTPPPRTISPSPPPPNQPQNKSLTRRSSSPRYSTLRNQEPEKPKWQF